MSLFFVTHINNFFQEITKKLKKINLFCSYNECSEKRETLFRCSCKMRKWVGNIWNNLHHSLSKQWTFTNLLIKFCGKTNDINKFLREWGMHKIVYLFIFSNASIKRYLKS